MTKVRRIKINSDHEFGFTRGEATYFGEIVEIFIIDGPVGHPVLHTVHMYEQGWSDVHLPHEISSV